MQLKCLSCKSPHHFIAQCPLINYIPNKELILYRYNASEPQKREKYLKRRLNRSDCRGNYRYIQIKAFEFKSNHLEELSKRSSSYEHSENEEESKYSQTLENIEEHSNEGSPHLHYSMERSLRKENNENTQKNHKETGKSSKNLSNPVSPLIPSETKFKNLRIQIEKIEKHKQKTNEEAPKFPEKSMELIGDKTPNSKIPIGMSSNLKRRESKLTEVKSSGLRKEYHKGEIKAESTKSINLNDEPIFKIMDFDKAKDYKFYYPHNNHIRVIKHLQHTKSKKRAQSKKSITSSKNFFSGLLAKSPFLSSARRREMANQHNKIMEINDKTDLSPSKRDSIAAFSNEKIM